MEHAENLIIKNLTKGINGLLPEILLHLAERHTVRVS